MAGKKGVMRQRVDLDVDVMTMARQRMAYAFDMFDHIAVAFSGGKDSTVCLELALEEAKKRGRLPLDVIHWDEEAIPYETEHYVRRRWNDPDLDVRWYCVPVQHFNACARSEPWWWPWDPDKEELWVRPMPPEAITSVPGFPIQPPEARLPIPKANGLIHPPEQYGQVGLVMGIRADESLTRYRAVVRKDVENYIIQVKSGPADVGNIYKVYPIYDFTTWDVWRAIGTGGGRAPDGSDPWDYNAAYDQMEMAGVHPNQQRCAPPYGTEPIQGLYRFAQCWPDIWDRMINRVAGADTAARYARTELYNFGSNTEKPDGVSWEQFLIHYLKKFPPDVRVMTARRIRDEINMHYRNTDDPILDACSHPETGLSWGFLFTLASRSDPKNRKIASSNVSIDPAARAEHRAKYELERRYLIETGRLDPRRRSGVDTSVQSVTKQQEEAMDAVLAEAEAKGERHHAATDDTQTADLTALDDPQGASA